MFDWLLGKKRQCDLCGVVGRSHTVTLEDVVVCDLCHAMVVTDATREPESDVVELTSGYSWECPECEEQIWADEVPVELTDEFPQTWRDEEAAGSQFTKPPPRVFCVECNKVYKTAV
jgi:hypothetical protein